MMIFDLYDFKMIFNYSATKEKGEGALAIFPIVLHQISAAKGLSTLSAASEAPLGHHLRLKKNLNRQFNDKEKKSPES